MDCTYLNSSERRLMVLNKIIKHGALLDEYIVSRDIGAVHGKIEKTVGTTIKEENLFIHGLYLIEPIIKNFP